MEAAEDLEDAVPLLEPSSPSDQRSQAASTQNKRSKLFSMKQTALIRPPRGLDLSTARRANLRYVYLLTAFVSIGALLFGYDQGVMGVIVADDRWLDLMKPSSPWVTGAVISLYDIGCAIGAMSIGFFADTLGRERTLSIASIVFIVGAWLQAASYSISQITLGRIILGYGVGACAGGVPLYISEISPPSLRGRIVAIEQMILCFGELIAFWLNYGFSLMSSKDWWRIPLAIQIVPAVVLAIGCWFFVPPSPRWLADQGRYSCAEEVLTRLHGSEAARLEVREIKRSIEFEKTVSKASWAEMFQRPIVRLTTLGMGIQLAQQVTGTNSILYYTPSLFEHGGIKDPQTRNLATGGVGIALFVSSWIPVFIFDRLGRKTWLQLGTVGMMFSMLGIAALQRRAALYPGDSGNYAIIVFPYLFYLCFNVSWGVGSWTYAAEIWPIRYRAKGNALSTASLWVGTYAVAQASPPIAAAIGWGLYVGYALICVAAFVFVRYALVETRNRTLEEMAQLFGIDDRLSRHNQPRPADEIDPEEPDGFKSDETEE